MLGVFHGEPVPNAAPPVEAAYHVTVPALTVAAKSSVPVPHLESGVAVSTVGISVTVAITAVLAELEHPALSAST